MGESLKPDIQGLPPFKSLNAEARRYLQDRLRRYKFSTGDLIVERGKRGNFWALVGYGLVDLDFGNQNIQTLLPGQAFGEAMLSEGLPSSASVTARSEAGLWVITCQDWLEALSRNQLSQTVKNPDRISHPWVWLASGLILFIFAAFFIGPDLLQFTNERLVSYALSADRLDLAEKYLKFSLGWQPRSATLYDAYGYVLYVQGKMNQAVSAFENAVALDDALASAQNNLGVALLNNWQTEGAVQHLEAATELDPASPDSFFNLANAYQAAGDQEAAIKAYHRVLELEPEHKGAQEQWASLMMKKGDFIAAKDVWEGFLKADPGNVVAHRSLGIIAVLEGHPEQALLQLRQAYEAGERDAELYLYMGLAFKALEEPEKASAAFESALALSNDPALIQLAQYHLQDIKGEALR